MNKNIIKQKLFLASSITGGMLYLIEMKSPFTQTPSTPTIKLVRCGVPQILKLS